MDMDRGTLIFSAIGLVFPIITWTLDVARSDNRSGSFAPLAFILMAIVVVMTFQAEILHAHWPQWIIVPMVIWLSLSIEVSTIFYWKFGAPKLEARWLERKLKRTVGSD